MRAFRLQICVAASVVLVPLAGCSKPEAPEQLEQIEAAIVENDENSVVAGAFTGEFSAKDADGNEAIWTLNADNSFTLAADGIDPVGGSYTHTETENGATLCANPDDADAGEICWELTQPGEGESWTATSDDGSVLTVNRVGNGSN
ncbi:MAG: hypothetical protein ABJ239_11245 [Erythrobacter sp.]